MSGRRSALAAALRGDEHRVGLLAILGSAGVGLVAVALVGLASPAVVEATPLSAGWPLALVVGASTAAVVCTARAGDVDRRAAAIAAGVAAATVAILTPPVALGLPLPPETSAALLGGLSASGAAGLGAALAVPAFGLGAAVGFALSTGRL